MAGPLGAYWYRVVVYRPHIGYMQSRRRAAPATASTTSIQGMIPTLREHAICPQENA